MKLVWKLFLKDQRVLRWWIVAWIVVQLVEASILSYFAIDSAVFFFSWIIGATFVALLVHQESVAKKGVSFWGTRPLRHRHILLGKSLFVLLYVVLIPFLIKVGALWHTGFSGYLGLALIEWGTTYITALLVILALAVVTSRLLTVWVLAMLGWVGVVVLKALVESLKRQFEWKPEMAPWWDFPTAPLVVHIVLALGAIAIILNQYLTSNLKLSWFGIVMTMVGVSGVGLLPLIPNSHGSHIGNLPPSDAALDIAAEGLAEDLSRLSPMPPRYEAIGEREDRRIVSMRRFLERSAREDVRLSLTVDQRRTRIEFEDQILGSIHRHPLQFWFYPPHEEFLRVTGNGDMITSYTQAWPRLDLMEYDYRNVAKFKGQTGTFHGEVILTRAEPELFFRMPLKVGAEVRIGPSKLTITHIGREGSELLVGTVAYFPRRKWTSRWPGLPSGGLGGRNARLYHVPSRTVITESLDGGSSTEGSWPFPWRRTDEEASFSLTNRGSSFEVALLAPENFNASEWEVVGVSVANKATKRVPYEIPHFRLWWEAAETAEEFGERLAKIHLSDFESAEAYLWAVWYCWSDNLPLGSQVPLISKKLAALRPEHVETLIRVMQNRPRGDINMRPFFGTLLRLVGPEHKQLVLDNHDPDFDLLQVIIERGWEEEALPIMVAKAQPKYFTPPKPWLDFLLEHRPLDEALWFNMARRDFENKKIRDAVAKIPNFRYERLIDLRWENLKYRSWWLKPFKDVLTFGRPYSLTSLRDIVKARHYFRTSRKAPVQLVDLLATISDCPAEMELAEAWLEKHAESATFDHETKRYVTAQPEGAP